LRLCLASWKYEQSAKAYDVSCFLGGIQMSGLIISWLITTVAILVAAYIIPGIKVDSLGGALVGAAILGILNVVLKPIFVILTLPVTLLTLGLFLFVINALIFWLAGSLLSGFHVQSFWSALLGSLVVSIVSYLAHSIRF
jgi:putative membrane protein